MTTTAFCPICHISHCDHMSAPTFIKPYGTVRTITVPDRLHPTPIPTELSALRAQLADRDRTIADYRKMLDMQAATIMRLSEIEKGLNE